MISNMLQEIYLEMKEKSQVEIPDYFTHRLGEYLCQETHALHDKHYAVASMILLKMYQEKLFVSDVPDFLDKHNIDEKDDVLKALAEEVNDRLEFDELVFINFSWLGFPDLFKRFPFVNIIDDRYKT